MSDFTERARAEAGRRYEVRAEMSLGRRIDHSACTRGFEAGAEWAESELRDLLMVAYTTGYRDRQEERDHDPGKVLRDV